MAAPRFALLYATALAAAAALAHAGETAAPTLQADGDSLVATVGLKGDVTFKRGAQTVSAFAIQDTVETLAGDYAAFVETSQESVSNVETDLLSVKAELTQSIQDTNEPILARLAQLEKDVAAVAKQQTLFAGITGQVAGLQKSVKALSATKPTVCAASFLDMWVSKTKGSGAVEWLGDHGDNTVPIGTVAMFTCKEGTYMPGKVTTVTCRSTGWTPGPQLCKPCMVNCKKCSDEATCDECNEQHEIVRTPNAGSFQQLSLGRCMRSECDLDTVAC